MLQKTSKQSLISNFFLISSPPIPTPRSALRPSIKGFALAYTNSTPPPIISWIRPCEWVRTSDPVIRSPACYRWTTAPAWTFILGWMWSISPSFNCNYNSVTQGCVLRSDQTFIRANFHGKYMYIVIVVLLNPG